jgi:signal transduction histidine kinase
MKANVIPIARRSDAHRRALAERRANILEERRRSFLRLASHELRTPLNAVIGFSEILANELCGPLGAPQYKQYAQHVHLSGLKLLRLVNQMLEIVRLDGDATDLQTSSESLEHAIDDALDTVRVELRAKDLKVKVNSEHPLGAVKADPRGLRTVLCNLIQNSISFSPVGGEIIIRSSVRGERIDVTIIDQGEGVDPAEIPRLLRPFEQGENALTRTNEGAGLGLPIAQLLCRNMHGSLRLHCQPGHGLEATVSLPIG